MGRCCGRLTNAWGRRDWPLISLLAVRVRRKRRFRDPDLELAARPRRLENVPGHPMLGTSKLIAFVATSDPDRARTFYKDALGLRPVSDDRFALVFDANGTQLRIQKVNAASPPSFTFLGWEVADIAETIAGLVARGVVLQRYDFMKQDGLGVW